jgi:hypothetical protein
VTAPWPSHMRYAATDHPGGAAKFGGATDCARRGGWDSDSCVRIAAPWAGPCIGGRHRARRMRAGRSTRAPGPRSLAARAVARGSLGARRPGSLGAAHPWRSFCVPAAVDTGLASDRRASSKTVAISRVSATFDHRSNSALSSPDASLASPRIGGDGGDAVTRGRSSFWGLAWVAAHVERGGQAGEGRSGAAATPRSGRTDVRGMGLAQMDPTLARGAGGEAIERAQ